MSAMTTQERYNDIAKRSGLSEEIIRRVISAERESIVDSLKRGERATLIGRCVIKPDMRSRMEVGGEIVNYMTVKSSVATSLKARIEEVTDFETVEDTEEDNFGIRLRQIESLV